MTTGGKLRGATAGREAPGVRPPDDPAALAAGMLELARDETLRARLGAAGHRRVLTRFGLDRMVDETIEVYGEVISARKR